jgi:hypothetical protein
VPFTVYLISHSLPHLLHSINSFAMALVWIPTRSVELQFGQRCSSEIMPLIISAADLIVLS